MKLRARYSHPRALFSGRARTLENPVRALGLRPVRGDEPWKANQALALFFLGVTPPLRLLLLLKLLGDL